MPEVYSDTSPIQYLHQLDLLGLVPGLYGIGMVVVPEAVAREVEAGRIRGVKFPDLTGLPWLSVRRVPSQAVLVSSDLDRGEWEVLALAAESQDSLAILDDALARQSRRSAASSSPEHAACCSKQSNGVEFSSFDLP